VSGLDQVTLSAMAGNQLPFVSVLVPFWLVITFVRMEGGSWRQAFEVWPCALVAGASFAIMQHVASRVGALHLLTDVVAGVVSVACTALFLLVWRPKTRFLLRSERPLPIGGGSGAGGVAGSVAVAPAPRYPYTFAQTAYAWLPWAILIVCCTIWGLFKKPLNGLFSGTVFHTHLLGSAFGGPLSAPVWDMPGLHKLVQRMPPVVAAGAKPENAQFTINWVAAAGTGVFVAAMLTGLVLRLSAAQWREAVRRTASRMRTPVLVIVQVLGLGYLTRYSGTDAVLGLAFTSAGVLYPFFSAFLGWLGVFLTGSDTASNALFGSLQRITAQQLHLNPVLIVATNSTGGVMGKMIDAQSIVVATAATGQHGQEGRILRFVFWHSIALACLVGLLTLVQAYLLPSMIPGN
jgi:lactate permease